MKLIKKIAAIMLSIMMVLGMASVVSADSATSGTSTDTKGKITIENVTAGQTYKIYRILELESYNTTTESYAYKATTAWENFIKGADINGVYVTTDDNGYVTWKNNADAAAFAQKALAYANNTSNNISNNGSKTVEEGSDTVTFDNLDLGYYLVESSVGALCGLTTTNNEATIQEKNGVPAVEKKVQEDSTNTWGDSNTADIGQTVNFKTTITAQPGAQNYVLHDRMDTGLTFTDGSVAVKFKRGETERELTENIEYTLTTSGLTDGCAFEITFIQSFCDTLKDGDQIIVTYSATLNDDVVSKKEYKNETWLKYGDSNETNHDTTITKTFELPVFKYTTKDGNEIKLAGATFTLSKNTDGSNPIKLVNVSKDDTTGDIYRVAKAGDADTVTAVTTTKSGKFTIKGLDADTYYLTETKQPDGYNKLSASIKVVIAENGNITVGEDRDTVVESVKVLNNTGSVLPSTGGSGTTLIYILGAILVLGSSVVLITKKRMR